MTSTVVTAEATKTDVDAAPVSKAAKSRLTSCGVTHLTPVQERTLNALIVDQKDVLVQAPTGSGKTLAYLLPLTNALELEAERRLKLREETTSNDDAQNNHQDPGCVTAIIFLPTRELASQVFQHAERHVTAAGFPCILCVGGIDEKQSVLELKKKDDAMRVIIGTPGRIKELFDRRIIKTKRLRYQILDECDRLLDGGFEKDVEVVCVPPGGDCRTACLSATMPPGLARFLQKRLPRDHIRVSLVNEMGGTVGGEVEHLVFVLAKENVNGAIINAVDVYAEDTGDELLTYEPPNETQSNTQKGKAKGQTIVFVETKLAAERLAGTLAIAYEERSTLVTDTDDDTHTSPQPKKIKKRRVVSLHGDLPQPARDAAIASLRAGTCDVLVATDVAARGLDLPGVELVVHADLPKDQDAYAHRAGRAGRVGCAKKGVSLVLSVPGLAAQEKVSSLESNAKIRLRRLGCIGERVVTERTVAAVQASWEAANSRANQADAAELINSEAVDSKNTSVVLTQTTLARLGERSLMNDRFDELSVDLASIRGKQKGSSGGKWRGKGRGKR